MTMRWCVLTGALMLAFVYATLTYKNVVQNPPGVYTRWYDGTLQRINRFYPDGHLKSTTVYGDDGQTVIVLAELTDDGAIIHSKVRRPDGKVEEKAYSDDGKVILQQTIWSGDGTYYLVRRLFWDNGQLHDEDIKTEDGTVTSSRRLLYRDGTLAFEVHVLPNADQEAKSYTKGVLVERQLLKGNGDKIIESFRPTTGVLAQRVTNIALTSELKTEYFNADGTLLFLHSLTPDENRVVNILYDHGKMIVRQTGLDLLLMEVEQFKPGSDYPFRRVELDKSGQISAIYDYRANGTLEKVQHQLNGTVTFEEFYDDAGVKVLRETKGGEAEPVDPQLLFPLSPDIKEE